MKNQFDDVLVLSGQGAGRFALQPHR